MGETDHSLEALGDFGPPAAAAENWSPFVDTLQLAHKNTAGWPAELERVCRWYAPHLQRLHEDAKAREADLLQLAQIASTYQTRQSFLTELTLDPPDATSDKAGVPLRDEDYLISSTIHSAKGQEWKSVFVLNCAAAIVASAKQRSLMIQDVADFASVTGKGVTGRIGNRDVAVGNAKLLQDLSIGATNLEARANELRREGATAMFVAVDSKPAGVIAVADPIKQTTPAALARLRQDGVWIVMLTGDNRTTAEAVASKLRITDIEAEVLPEQKNAIVRRLRSEGHAVAMAGDGVNDAPALAEADVGVAMGTGTDVAMESAGVTLVKGDLAGIARARALSRGTMRNIRQNLVLAFVYMYSGFRWLRACLPRIWAVAQPNSRSSRNELQLAVCHWQS